MSNLSFGTWTYHLEKLTRTSILLSVAKSLTHTHQHSIDLINYNILYSVYSTYSFIKSNKIFCAVHDIITKHLCLNTSLLLLRITLSPLIHLFSYISYTVSYLLISTYPHKTGLFPILQAFLGIHDLQLYMSEPWQTIYVSRWCFSFCIPMPSVVLIICGGLYQKFHLLMHFFLCIQG